MYFFLVILALVGDRVEWRMKLQVGRDAILIAIHLHPILKDISSYYVLCNGKNTTGKEREVEFFCDLNVNLVKAVYL